MPRPTSPGLVIPGVRALTPFSGVTSKDALNSRRSSPVDVLARGPVDVLGIPGVGTWEKKLAAYGEGRLVLVGFDRDEEKRPGELPAGEATARLAAVALSARGASVERVLPTGAPPSRRGSADGGGRGGPLRARRSCAAGRVLPYIVHGFRGAFRASKTLSNVSVNSASRVRRPPLTTWARMQRERGEGGEGQ